MAPPGAQMATDSLAASEGPGDLLADRDVQGGEPRAVSAGLRADRLPGGRRAGADVVAGERAAGSAGKGDAHVQAICGRAAKGQGQVVDGGVDRSIGEVVGDAAESRSGNGLRHRAADELIGRYATRETGAR